MSTLVGYGSSDEDDDQQSGSQKAVASGTTTTSSGYYNHALHTNATKLEIKPATDPGEQTAVTDTGALQRTLVGPPCPPAENLDAKDEGLRPFSPYSARREEIRHHTMPIIPNFDIPPSPPGSPPSDIEQKFEKFLRLKQKGVHFNEKLAGSSALKNPALLQKLMSSAGLEEGDQYATALPKSLWDPSALPDWAYKEELTKSQRGIAKRREEEKSQTQRGSIDFVPQATTSDSTTGYSK